MHFPTLDAALITLCGTSQLAGSQQQGGGCIAEASCLTLVDGTRVFCKRGAWPALFQVEADGLQALAEAGLRVPRVLAVGDEEAFLLLEDCSGGQRGSAFWQDAGESLAALHRQVQAEPGWRIDNFIGATPQPNASRRSWPAFFAEQRLAFQIRLLRDRGLAEPALIKGVEALISKIDELLPTDEPTSLVHGDLWNGNLLCGQQGEAVFIDPAVYIGHREVDIAMTELFGGFAAAFYDAYRATWPLQPGYPRRRDIYNLYHVLNHANLFGGGYSSQALSMVRRFIR
jgi:protein-ribulosamine 3-kinase